jgi:hypothetical protein
VLLSQAQAPKCEIEPIGPAIDRNCRIFGEQRHSRPFNPRRVGDYERKPFADVEYLIHRALAHLDLFCKADGLSVSPGERARYWVHVYGHQSVPRGSCQGKSEQPDLSGSSAQLKQRTCATCVMQQFRGPNGLRDRPFPWAQDPIVERDRQMPEHH